MALDAGDHQTLRALGMTTTQLTVAALCRAMLVALAAAVLAPAVAVALSPLFPIGLAATAEIRPGVSVDVGVLAAGAALTLVLVLLRAGLSAWRVARTAATASHAGAAPVRRSRVADALAGAGLPAPAATGVRLSLEPGPNGAAVAVRGAMVVAAAAVAGVMAALIFGTSLGALAGNPRQQGWNWDVIVGNPNSQGDVASRDIPLLGANPAVGSFAGVVFTSGLRLAGHQVDAAAIDSERGEVFPTVVEGREPRQADEILVGSATLAAIGHHVGDTVEAQAGDRRMTVRVVGRAVTTPPPGMAASGMNKGAIVTGAAARQLFPDAAPPSLFLVRYAAGVDRGAARASLERDFPGIVLGFTTADEVGNLRRVGGLPFVLAALLVVLGAGVMGHALVTTIRRRRQDLAVLKTLGFVRRQVTATVAWQATTVAVIALVAGLPLGIALGRWSWALVVGQLGSRSAAVIPVGDVVVVVLATVVLVNLLAGAPGWVAARLRPATVLRAQ